jgi:hypothetical protein
MILGALQEVLKYMWKPLYLQLWYSMIKLKHVIREKKGWKGSETGTKVSKGASAYAKSRLMLDGGSP